MRPADPQTTSDATTPFDAAPPLDTATLFDDPTPARVPVEVVARDGAAAREVLTVVEMWTDGACKGNPGPGGWGAWMRSDGRERELFGGEPLTTNNRMELSAVIEGLRVLTRPCAVTLHVDSTYVMNGMSRWLAGWKRNGWLTGEKKPVKNKELWQALEAEIDRHAVTWVWVKGHSGDPGNERADELANRGVEVGRLL